MPKLRNALADLKSRMANAKPDLVGITSMTPTIHDDVKVAAIAKELGAKVVIGGPHINAMPEDTMRISLLILASLVKGVSYA